MNQTAALEGVVTAIDRFVEQRQDNLNLSLMNGATGLAMLYYYYAQTAGKAHYSLRGDAVVNTILQQLSDSSFTKLQTFHSFSTGLTGIAHGLFHLEQKGFIAVDFKENFSSLDEFLVEAAVADYKNGISDFLHGPMGIYYYLLNQHTERDVLPELRRLNEAFLSEAVQDERGLRIRNMILEEVNEKEYDLGLAHGLTGILLILLKALEQQCHVDQVKPMVEAGLQYLLAAEKPMPETGGNSFFPTSVNEAAAADSKENQYNYVVRLAWCYGDLNMAWLLVKAGKILARPELLQKGIAIAKNIAARRTYPQHQVGDVFYCHGASGVAYIFAKLYQETAEPVLQEARQFWMEETLTAISKSTDAWSENKKPFSLLEGLVGLGLALLPEKNTGWDEIFLMN